ncbi:MAG: 30S ribosome-binding factor RbfA [Actinobacteria bacterium]|nr:30S ribosome-binding factor RbfA [Actinomycetota bacterium]
MARVGELCREIIADELERIADERLPLVTVTHVEIDPDLRHGKVFWSSLGEDDEAVVAEVLDEHRADLQRAIARQARLKRTPELSFRLDPVVANSRRIEELLRHEAESGRPIQPEQ